MKQFYAVRTLCQLALGILAISSFNLAQARASGPITIAAPKTVDYNLAPAANSLVANELRISGTKYSSFIKVHFDYFNIPKGAVVEVSDPTGTEVYRYTQDQKTQITYDGKLGEDGKTKFAALSINGDTAVVRLNLNGATWNFNEHGIRVRRIMEGFSPEQIKLEQAKFLSTCGINERKDAVCYASSNPAEYERSRPVARLVMNGGLCTTWRVGSGNFMMTNNHCIASQSETTASEVWFNYQYTTCGGKTLAPTVKIPAGQFLKTDAALDYTLYTLKDPTLAAQFGNFGLDVRDAIKDEQIFIPQHGEGNPKELAITSDSNTGGVCRVDVPVQNGTGTKTDIGYRCDTAGGSSGSPVLASSSRRVIALHHLGGCPSVTNSGAQIKLIWPQISSFFNNVIPTGDVGTPAPTPITVNVPLAGQSGQAGAETIYVLDLAYTPTTLSFATSGGSGDVQLYVKKDAVPSVNNADCKSEKAGNAESCSISGATAGKYYVLLKGQAAYSDVSLVATATSNSVSFENTTRFDVPDNNSTGITSPIKVTRSGDTGTIAVNVNIIHPYSGDLVVTLIAPNGNRYTLQSRTGGSSDNIVKTFNVNVGAVPSNGDWKLNVTDRSTYDKGYLQSWRITFPN